MSTSAFQKCMEEIARSKAINGGPSNDDLLSAIIAANDDRREATADTDKRLLNLSAEFGDHRLAVDARFKAVNAAMSALKTGGSDRVEEILEAEHETVRDRALLAAALVAYKAELKAGLNGVARDLAEHRGQQLSASPRRNSDPLDLNFGEDRESGDMRRVWRVGRWLVTVLVVAMTAFGISYWADSCSRTQYWGPSAPTVTTPAPTATK